MGLGATRNFSSARRVDQILRNGNPRLADIAQACLRIPIEAPAQQGLDRRRYVQLVELDRAPQHVGERMHDRIAAEQTLAAEHFPQDDAVGPDIGAAIDRSPRGLLRAHVRGGAEDHPGLRHRRRRDRRRLTECSRNLKPRA